MFLVVKTARRDDILVKTFQLLLIYSVLQCWFVTVLILDANRQLTLNSQASLSNSAVSFWSVFLLHSEMTYIHEENEARAWEMT